MSTTHLKTARALYPHRPELWPPDFIYEPLPAPDDHPELDLWGLQRPPPFGEPGLVPAPAASPPRPPPSPGTPALEPELLPARMLNEFVYCPRLFYYEHVEGVFLDSADTERGAALHEKVDRGKGALPKAKKVAATAPRDEPSPEVEPGPPDSEAGSTIHSRSAMLGSARLGVVAKMDLIEVSLARDTGATDAPPQVLSVTPVDYKAGAPRQGEDATPLWDTDKMQLGLQILILRDNGYSCDTGVIYYRATKQRVPLVMTPETEAWILDQIAKARLTAASPDIPPPLVNSPKCARCSLAPVCLPDETRMLQMSAQSGARTSQEPSAPRGPAAAPAPPRRLIAARDDERALYLNTQGHRVGVRSERLVVKEGDHAIDEVRLLDVSHVALFGNIQISTQAVRELCDHDIPLAWFSMGGWFYGLTRGHALKNVHTRIRQFAVAASPPRCLDVARAMVRAKIRNQRTMLMRLHGQPPAAAVTALKEIAARVSDARGLDELLGMEGAAAALYFQHFSGMIKIGAGDDPDDEIPGLEPPENTARRQAESAAFTFDFQRRRRRPPTDPVNALLSLAYSLLAKDCTIAAFAVGLDPYVGFYHQPRHGRPALALDLMEEFRPLIAESAVLTAINNRMITPGHFVRAGDAVNLNAHGRKAFFHAYEQRMNTLITHPVFDYKVSYRRVLELQARLLARWLTGEIPDYIPMVTR
jgi:CRISPR-associated protein Cas1